MATPLLFFAVTIISCSEERLTPCCSSSECELRNIDPVDRPCLPAIGRAESAARHAFGLSLRVAVFWVCGVHSEDSVDPFYQS